MISDSKKVSMSTVGARRLTFGIKLSVLSRGSNLAKRSLLRMTSERYLRYVTRTESALRLVDAICRIGGFDHASVMKLLDIRAVGSEMTSESDQQEQILTLLHAISNVVSEGGHRDKYGILQTQLRELVRLCDR
jgi:hypothetical protein